MYADYEIQAALIQTLNKALKDMDVPGFTVIPRNMPTMTTGGSNGFNLDRSNILIDPIHHQREGWQSHRYLKIPLEDGTVKQIKREEWLETWTWQLSATKRREIDEPGTTITAYDALSRIEVWLNSSVGGEYMRHRKTVPFAPFWVFHVKRRPYKDDSHINQIEATLDFKINLVQFLDSEPIHITDFEVHTHPI